MRSLKEISKRLDEAYDKVLDIRNHKDDVPDEAHNKILGIRIDKDDYFSDWSIGYWHGVLGTLRWILGNEKEIF